MDFIEARKIASSNMQEGIVADAKGTTQEAIRFFGIAFEAEKQAALSLLMNFEKEPFRSVLFRSATSLAMNCKRYEEAKQMVHFGLAGKPPKDVEEQLVSIYLAVERATKGNPVSQSHPSKHNFFLEGTLIGADILTDKITIFSERLGVVKVIVKNNLDEIVRNYWNEYVNAYILKQGKKLILVAIDKIFMQKTA
jgi:hypothetical protein